jgi:AP2 domain
MRTITLHGIYADHREAVVDDGDYAQVSQYKWYAKKGRRGALYAIANIPQPGGGYKTTGMHALITGWSRVDHVDHDTLNNQRYNLRESTPLQSSHNTRSRAGTSQYKGVLWEQSRGRWKAEIRASGKKRFIGRFDDEEEAARAYDRIAKVVHGRFAVLNFPSSG